MIVKVKVMLEKGQSPKKNQSQQKKVTAKVMLERSKSTEKSTEKSMSKETQDRERLVAKEKVQESNVR